MIFLGFWDYNGTPFKSQKSKMVKFSGQKWDFKLFSFSSIKKSIFSLYELRKNGNLSISVH